MIVDDNFIGNRRHAKTMLEALIEWQAERNEPFGFFAQVSVNIGRDREMIDLMTAANFSSVFLEWNPLNREHFKRPTNIKM